MKRLSTYKLFESNSESPEEPIQEFKLDLVKDYIESATDYMESIGWNMESKREWKRYLLRWINVEPSCSVIEEELKITYMQKNDRNSV